MGEILKYIRYIWFGTVMATGGILGLLYSLLRPFHKNNSYPIALYIRHLVNPFFGLKFQIINKETLWSARPCVFVSNHQTNYDMLVAATVVPPGVVSLGKKQILFFPIFGLFYWLSGHILIDRKNRKSAFQSMQKVKDAINNQGTSVWIMPEGTRSKGKGIATFKKGAFHTAVGVQCPVVPISISTFDKGVDIKRLRGNKIIVKVGDPISTVGMTGENVSELRDLCEKIIRNDVAQIDQLLS